MNELINRGVILTTRGQQLIEDAKATGRDIQLKKFGVGDGGGDAFNPTLDELKALTAVPGEWDKRNLNSVNPIESGGYTVEGLVPSDVGEGLWVRIFGIYTIDDQLMYVFLYPVWQKPQNNGNLLIELPFKATIGISDAPDFNLVIDPSLVAATQQYVLQKIKDHVDKESPHEQYAKTEEVTQAFQNHTNQDHPHEQYAKTEEVTQAFQNHTSQDHPHEQYQLGKANKLTASQGVLKKRLNVFASHLTKALPTGVEGDWLEVMVLTGVNLANGACKLNATSPQRCLVKPYKGAATSVTTVNIIETGRVFRFIFENGVWTV